MEIEPAVPSCEDEVAALGELLGIERVERELGRIEVADSVQLAVQSPKHAGQAIKVCRLRRRDDVEVFRSADVPMRRNGQSADDDVVDLARVKGSC
jgi:hypothetical protein